MKVETLTNFIKFLKQKKAIRINKKDFVITRHARRFLAIEGRNKQLMKLFDRLEKLDCKPSSHKVVSEILSTNREINELLKMKI